MPDEPAPESPRPDVATVPEPAGGTDSPGPAVVRTSEDFDVDLDGDGVPDGAGTLDTTVYDIDGDGRPDAIHVRETIMVDQDDDGTPETLRVTESLAVDLDGDGVPDIVDGVEITAADLDGDGEVDVLEERRLGADGTFRGPLDPPA